jgi:hypothetical protein
MAKSSAEKMKAYRARKRAAGYRQIQLWVRDTRSPEFKAEARRQSLIAAQVENEDDYWAWADGVQAPLPPYDWSK